MSNDNNYILSDTVTIHHVGDGDVDNEVDEDGVVAEHADDDTALGHDYMVLLTHSIYLLHVHHLVYNVPMYECNGHVHVDDTDLVFDMDNLHDNIHLVILLVLDDDNDDILVHDIHNDLIDIFHHHQYYHLFHHLHTDILK